MEGFADPIVERYQRFLAANGIGIAGIEFIADAQGRQYTYDVNTNTNYNGAAEAAISAEITYEDGRKGTLVGACKIVDMAIHSPAAPGRAA